MRPEPDADRPELLIFPCNGNGIEAIDCIGSAYRWLGFVTDGVPAPAHGTLGFALWSRQALVAMPSARVLAVPGSSTTFSRRRDVIDGLGVSPERFATVIHPRACISPLARIGRNVLIMAGVVVTANAVIGDHVCILPNTVVHHDSRVGAWSLVGSNVAIAGGVEVGENCYIGSGSAIRHGLRIGDGTLVGLGSCVIRDTGKGSVVAGNPARVLR